jgi:hypothetical protein
VTKVLTSSATVLHPTNVYPDRFGAVGALILPPEEKVPLATEDPPVGLNVTAYVGATGVTGVELSDGPEFPRAFVALTVKEYAVLFVSDENVHDVLDVEQVAPPGLAVTV